MKRRFLAGLVAATAVTTSMVMVSAADAATPDTTAAGAQSSGVTPNGSLDPSIQVGAGFTIVASLRGVGKQIYDCAGGVYVFREPAAGLFTSRGVPAAIHGKGPFWTNFDGSRVDGTADGSFKSPDPKSVAWLRLKGAPTGASGVFSKVAFIQRIDTRGGVQPPSCTAPSTIAVDYTANYVFWAPQ